MVAESAPLSGWRAAVRRASLATWSFLRGTWTVLGVSVLLLVLLETGYRAQRSLRETLGRGFTRHASAGASAPAPSHPLLAQPWYADYARDFDASDEMRWSPYVYFRRAHAYHGRYITIDSAGRRVTPQPAAPAQPAARVFFFGGSTMWGSYLRDDHTIPAEAVRRIQAAVGPDRRVEVTNFGETGWVFTQCVLELELQLRAGNRPDVVVFYNGINEAFSLLQNGKSGVGLNETNRESEFALGRRLAWSGHDDGVAKDLHRVMVYATAALSQLQLVRKLQTLVHREPERALPSADSAAREVARTYTGNVRLVEALAHEYGFTPVYVWQPTLHATHKRLTPFEQRLMRSVSTDDFQRRLRDTHLAIPHLLDSAMAPLAPGRFVDEAGLFTGDTTPVFVDQVGHNTEVSIPTIVEGMWPALRSALVFAIADSASRQ